MPTINLPRSWIFRSPVPAVAKGIPLGDELQLVTMKAMMRSKPDIEICFRLRIVQLLCRFSFIVDNGLGKPALAARSFT
jgi:hypothetical protein